MAVSKTSLSAGLIIYEILNNDPEVKMRANKVYPVVTDTAKLPYVVYRRVKFSQDNTKGPRMADTIGIEVSCYTKDYFAGVELAEAVRAALDHMKAEMDNGMSMRSCYLEDCSEDYVGDAYEQTLLFTIKI